jgi:hypothetical protein
MMPFDLLNVPLGPFASFGGMIGATVSPERETDRVHRRVAAAEASPVALREHDRSRDHEDLLLGLAGLAIVLVVTLFFFAIELENWVAAIQMVGFLMILVPVCGLATPVAFLKFDQAFSIDWKRKRPK